MQVLATLALPAVLLTSCAATTPKEKSVFCMDTVFSFTLYGANAEEYLQSAESLCAELDASFSESSATSVVEKIAKCQVGQSCELTESEAELLKTVTAFSKASGGKFDATVGSYKRLWNTSTEQNKLPTDEERQAAGRAVGNDTYQLSDTVLIPQVTPLYFDFGSSVKGYTADRLLSQMQEYGVSGFVSLGGCIAVSGKKPDQSPYRFGIQCPEVGNNQCVGYLTVNQNCVLSTSGDYQRYYSIGDQTYSQILDPTTGLPIESPLLSVTVIGKEGLTTDILSTWLMFMSPEEAIHTAQNYGCSAICVTKECKIFISADLAAFFEANPGCEGYEMGGTVA